MKKILFFRFQVIKFPFDRLRAGRFLVENRKGRLKLDIGK
jgi:hypothetical protein